MTLIKTKRALSTITLGRALSFIVLLKQQCLTNISFQTLYPQLAMDNHQSNLRPANLISSYQGWQIMQISILAPPILPLRPF